ncbi:peroxidase [Mycolicibacterium chitae]|uniref:Peroxidase BpoB n=1 Tax=Mycolicibacterium chitae TaxID=1792 RepID=A0A3S4T2E8_MYCCI|nr:alpha/beta hydrolase [Mycolicibacterium chitae]MCV7105076.1 alpha/beta hydrolase [Mycolicibacterium chitae]BBZ05643.1 peroxidase [Mycolicibacterium chitae]VEG49255.1 peroxidase BpoB [Mycolicibacterium chitae]
MVLRGNGLNLATDHWSSPLAGPDRPEVVLLHGGGQTRGSWKSTGQRLAAAGWTTYAVDARGHGDSDWSGEGDYSSEAMVRDVVAVAKSRAMPPILVGASMGGQAALVAIGENPGIASGLVLVDIAVSPSLPGVERVREFLQSGLSGFTTLEEAAQAVAAYNPHRARPPKPDGLARNLRQRDGRWYWHWDPAFIGNRGPGGETHQHRRARGRRAARNVDVPTLLVKGAQSDVVTAEGVLELRTLIPHATYVEVGGTGHMVSGDDNDAFTAAVLKFLHDLG